MTEKNSLTAELGPDRRDGSADWVRIENADLEATLEITLRRTVRVEDSDNSSYIPRDNVALPLFNIRNITGLPDSVQKCSLLMPIHGKTTMEDMEVNAHKQQCDIDQTLDLERLSIHDGQDYVVVTPQKFLDGYAVGEGLVRQFVAMPTNSGYAADEQLTGTDLGGIRFVVTPLKRGIVQMKPRENHVTSSLSEREQTQEICVKTYTGKTLTMEVSKSDTILDIKLRLRDRERYSVNKIYLMYAGSQLEDDRTLHQYNIQEESTLHVESKILGGGGWSVRGEMSVAAGGKIEQTIEKDPWDAKDWDYERTIAFKILLVNAPLLSSVTGTDTRQPGPKAMDDTGAHLALGDEHKPSYGKGDLAGVKPVATLDKKMVHPMAKAAAKIARTPTFHPVVRVQRVAKDQEAYLGGE